MAIGDKIKIGVVIFALVLGTAFPAWLGFMLAVHVIGWPMWAGTCCSIGFGVVGFLNTVIQIWEARL